MDWNTLLLAFINSWAIPSLTLMFMVIAMTGVSRRKNYFNHDREIKRDILEDSRRRFEMSNEHALAVQASRDTHNRTVRCHEQAHDQRMAEIKQQNTALTAEVKAGIDKAITEFKTKDGKGSPNLDDHRPKVAMAAENGAFERF